MAGCFLFGAAQSGCGPARLGYLGDDTMKESVAIWNGQCHVKEELGLTVDVQQLIAEVTFHATSQSYFLAKFVDGQFGTGVGQEMLGLQPPD
jgi:hypothetical protein